MLRVLATIRQSQYANTMKSEQNDLITWVGEIQSGIYATLVSISPGCISYPLTHYEGLYEHLNKLRQPTSDSSRELL
jgi:hypothetical protein